MMFCSFLFGQTPDWGDFNYRDYDFNMTVTAVVEIDDDEQANSNLIVAPFYGNERRGNIISGQVISGRTYYYLGIFGNYGDVVTFKLYDSENQTEYISSSSVNFVPNGIVGSPSNPYIVNFNSVAKVGDVKFGSVIDAVNYAEAGQTVTLTNDSEITSTVVINKAITLDLNGKKVEQVADKNAVRVTSDNVIITDSSENGDGAILNELFYAVTVGRNDQSDRGSLTINGGKFEGQTTSVYVACGDLEIRGGEFSINEIDPQGYKYVVNLLGNKDANALIYGGTFHNFNPQNNEAEGVGTNFCAEGYIAKDNGNNTYTVIADPAYGMVARIGDTYFATLEAALEAAQAGDEIDLLANVTIANPINVTFDLTIDGNGKTLTYTGSNRAIDMPNDADANYNVTINDLTVNCNASYCERGINYNDNGELNLNNVTVQGAAYALNLPGSSDNAKVTIKDSSLTGLIALNVWGKNAIINATDSHFTSVDNNTTEGYAAVKLNNDGETSAEGTVIYICGGKIDVTGSASEDTEAASNATETGVIDICEDTEVNGGVKTLIAVIRYSNGTSYTFETLAEAVETAKNGETVILLRNATGAGIVINKSITIDFNGKTYTFNEGVGSTGTPSNGFQILAGNTVTLNNGTLNVAEAASDKFYILVQNYANLNVVNMNLDGTNLDKWSTTDGDSYVLSNNSGNVSIEGNTNIKANNEGDLAFAFDACDKSAWGYELPTVTVSTTGLIDGAIEVSANLYITKANLSARNYILMQENGQFFHNGITATIKKQISKSSGVQGATTDWNTISTPVVGGSEIPEAEAGKHDLYYYDEANQYWRYVDGQGEEMKLKSGQGYLYTNHKDVKFSFTGQLNTSAVNVHLSYTNGIALAGFNLIGNPFTHEISVENMDMDSEAVLTDGFYTITKEGAWQARQGEETIAPMQSVLVKADKAATLTINPKANKTRKASNASLEIAVYNNEYKDVAYVSFGEGLGLDKIEHRNSDIPMVFIPVNGKEYAIATMSSDVKEIPVAFKAMTMGQYTFAVNAKDCEFSEMYLVDNLTGEITDLLNNEYTFLATSKDDANRFVIKFAEETETTTSTENFAYINNGEIIIDSIEGKGVVKIYDMLGRPMSEYGVSESARISTSAFADGIYIIQMSDDNGVKVQKVVID